jgi:4-amino-4-deoxy-L-arabinose transferase-like glycosyltransferase
LLHKIVSSRQRSKGTSARKARPAPPQTRRTGSAAALVGFLAAVFALKAAVAVQLGHQPLLQADAGLDTSAYLNLARSVLGGNVFLGPGLYYVSPLYVYSLALTLAIRDSLTFVRIVQAALGTVAVWCIFAMAREWFGRRAAWTAAVLAALAGEFTFYEIVILQSSLDTVLTASALLCLTLGLTRAATPHARRFAIACGALFGLQILNRPNIGLAVTGICLVLLVTRRFRQAGYVIAGTAVVLSCLVVRNVVVSRQFALLTSHGGLNLYIGNHDGATGQYVAVPGIRADIEGQAEDTKRVAEQAMGRSLTDSQTSQYFADLALAWMRAHPEDAVVLFARKLALAFNRQHQWLDLSYPYYAHDVDSLLGVLIVGPWLIVPLGLAGLFAIPSSRSRRDYLVWASFVPLYALSLAVFFVGERYRLPLLIALAVPAGGAVDALITIAVSRPRRMAAAIGIGGAAVAGLALAYWPFHLDDGRFAERLRLSKVLMNRGDFDGAARELEAAHDIRPDDTAAEFNLGVALVSDGRADEGIPHIRHAVEQRVPIAGARYALVHAMEVDGKPADAARLLRTYQPAGEDDAESCYQVALMAMELDARDVAVQYLRRALELRPDWPEAQQLLAEVLWK